MLNSEDRIFEAAKKTFLLYGYHATTLHQIAVEVGINKSAIHYYFRSKQRLYVKVVKYLLNNILTNENNFNSNQEIEGNQKWFLFTEMYNNQICFENVLKELYVMDWAEKLNELKVKLKI
jgi:AcrR family transcriptional regulator